MRAFTWDSYFTNTRTMNHVHGQTRHMYPDISTFRVCHRNEGHVPIRSPLAVFFAVIPGNSGLGSVAL